MDFAGYFPIWNKMTENQKERLLDVAYPLSVKAGTVVHNGGMD